jgi:hypothetical protein
MNARFWDGTRLAERLSPGNSHFSTFDQLLPNSYYGIVVGDAVNDSFGFYIEGEGAIGNPLTLAELLLVEDWLSLRTELTAAHFELEGRGTASGHITYFRRVPEPAAFVLIWLSLAAIGLGRRRPAA